MKYPQLLSMPTAVSDWLEEQLEARGIDAVVYTRYVLSILYRDPVDVICSEQELQFSPQPNKEVRRSSSGRKRFRRSSGWCSLDLSDADKLKRSAAVQCLMSASDQECGFESLVDELCEKLKEVNRGLSPISSSKEDIAENRASSPGDPAKRYYAAFPALSRDSGGSPGFINLIPKWLGSPKKRNRKQPVRTAGPKTDPEMKTRCFTNNAGQKSTSRLTKFKQLKKHFKEYNFKYVKKIEEKDFWNFYNCENNKNSKMDDKENNNNNNKEEWRCSDDSFSMYDDMIQDNIRNLLDSPIPKDEVVSVEMMNMANMKHEGNNNSNNNKNSEHHSMFFDETIWSCKLENAEDFLQNKLKAITIDAKPICSIENEKNALFENQSFFSIWPTEKWSELDERNDSLSAINHSDTSLFQKVIHKQPSHENHATPPPRKITKMEEKFIDLWDSHHCRFKPINETIERDSNRYSDGMTFHINSDFDKIDWCKTTTGFFYVSDDPLQRKYLEFNRGEQKKGELVPKYLVKQDDELLQTESNPRVSSRRKLYFLSESEDEELNGYLTPTEDEDEKEEEEMEIKKEVKCSCSKIGWDAYWNNADHKLLDKDTIKNIWKDGDSCSWCMSREKEDKLSIEEIQLKLREECILDGEQLLLDLNSVQNKFLEELPAIEDSFNISELLNGIKERKRRHSTMNSDGIASDFFTSRLQEDCLMKIGRLPVLRSMTLGRVG